MSIVPERFFMLAAQYGIRELGAAVFFITDFSLLFSAADHPLLEPGIAVAVSLIQHREQEY
jgi:hypothetical protein